MSWRWGWQKVRKESDEIIVSTNDDKISLYKKQRPQLGDMPSKKPKSIFYRPEYSSGNGKAELVSVLGKSLFGYPKPLTLILDFFIISSKKSSTILDFFAGSGTTLHATMQLNAEDGGHRQCILVTNNENGICENVTYERNKRVIQGYTTPKGEKIEGLTRNNLRYYKTKLISRDKTAKNLRLLTSLSTEMLCIRNDVYMEKPFVGKKINKDIARYFENARGTRRMLVVYREEAVAVLAKLIGTLPECDEKLMVYVFSPNGYAYDEYFGDVADKVTLCAIPDAILNVYRRMLPKRKSQRQKGTLDGIDNELKKEDDVCTDTNINKEENKA